MLNILSNFHFLRPWWLLLLLPLAFLAWRLWQQVQRNNPWETVCDPQLLPHLIQTRGKTQSHLALLVLAVAWVIATLALAGPTWSQLTQQVYRSTAGNVIVFDASPAMLATDMQPTRFMRAKYKLLDLLKASVDGSIGLVAYSGEAYSVAPVTNDSQTLINLANTLDPSIMPVQGNNLAQGLQLAADMLQQAQVDPGTITVITGSVPDAAAIKVAGELAKKNITINVLGVGTPQHELAQAGDGRYVAFSSSDRDIKELLSDERIAEAAGKSENQEKVSLWRDQGQWLIVLLIPFALLAFRRGWWEEV